MASEQKIAEFDNKCANDCPRDTKMIEKIGAVLEKIESIPRMVTCLATHETRLDSLTKNLETNASWLKTLTIAMITGFIAVFGSIVAWAVVVNASNSRVADLIMRHIEAAVPK